MATDSFHSTDRFTRYSVWLKDHVFLASLIILVCALSIRVFFTYRADPTQLVFPDSGTYLDTAESLRDSGSFLNKYNSPEITRTPGYPLFLAALMTICGSDLRIVLIAQTIIVSLSVLVLYWLARRLVTPLMAFVGTVLAALSPWGAVRAGFLLTDGLFLLLLALLFYAMHVIVQRARTPGMVTVGGMLIGLLTSAVVFVRPVLPLIPLVALILFVFSPGDRRMRAWMLSAVMVICALLPMHLWTVRNIQEAQFHGFSDVSGKAAWQWLASSVQGQVPGAAGDRWAILREAEEAETKWTLSLQDADTERWRLASRVFRDHPFLTVYTFGLNAAEAFIHPHPGILTPASLNFRGDTIVLGGVWAGLVLCAAFGVRHAWTGGQRDEIVDRKWLMALLMVCSVMTLTGGVGFGAGSRYRAPLELIVPLLAGVGLVRLGTLFIWKYQSIVIRSTSATNLTISGSTSIHEAGQE